MKYDLIITTTWIKCRLEKKHNYEERYFTIENLFKILQKSYIKILCVLFTNDEEKMNELINKTNVKSVIIRKIDLEELYSNKYLDYFEWALDIIPKNSLYKANRIVNSDILRVWHNKLCFYNNVCNEYKGKSKFYAWMDVGMFYDADNIITFDIKNVPKNNKILINHIDRLFVHKTPSTFGISANFMITPNPELVIKFSSLYYGLLDMVVENRVVIKDNPTEEPILDLCVNLNPKLYLINNEPNWLWFYDYILKCHETKIIPASSMIDNCFKKENNEFDFRMFYKLYTQYIRVEYPIK